MLKTRWLSRLQTATLPISTLTVHVELLPDGEAVGVMVPHPRAGSQLTPAPQRYRISKSWGNQLPQAPRVTMRSWSDVLHPTPVPAVQGGTVEFHLSLSIS